VSPVGDVEKSMCTIVQRRIVNVIQPVGV